MVVDWEFELGGNASIIDAHWSGYIDLGARPEQAANLEETASFPPLAAALRRLNASSSAVWTSKCDFWSVDLAESHLDPIEMDAPKEEFIEAYACYIDLLNRDATRWSEPKEAENFARALCALLKTSPLRSIRIDLIIRRAVFAGDEESLGVTAYLIACGVTDHAARESLARALAAFADSVVAA